MTTTIDPAVGVEVATDAVARACRAGADEAKALHSYTERFEVNFDTETISLVRSTVSDMLSITVFDDGRRGTSDVMGRAPDDVDRAVAHAITAARAGVSDPANVLPAEAVEPAPSAGDTEPERDVMLDAVLRLIDYIGREFPTIRSDRSYYAFDCTWSSYANSHDRTQHARRGTYMATLVVAGKDDKRATSMSYAAAAATSPFSDLAAVDALHGLLTETVASFDPQPIPATFVGDVIFTPHVMPTLTANLGQALGGLALIRNVTPFRDQLGKPVAAPVFSLSHRPSELVGAAPFDGEGFVNTDLDVIRDGVLENFLVDWYCAQKLGRPRTAGNADLVVAPGTTPLADLIAGTERGILLGRYSGNQPNQNLDFSGVAKNSFFIEDGKVVGPIAETMVAGNFASVLREVRGVSRETIDFGHTRQPWVASQGVTISTK